MWFTFLWHSVYRLWYCVIVLLL